MLHVINGRNKTALPEKYARRPITAESCHLSSQPITFDHRDYLASIWRPGWAALVLDPIIDGYHFTRVLMDGGSGLNLIYQDTIREMGIDPMKICHSNTTIKGVTPGPRAHCMGSLLLKVIFGFPDNFYSGKLTFHIAPFQSGYQALLGREAFARFNAIPHYASLTLKMPGPRGIITVNGNIERSLCAEENVTALAAAHSKLPRQLKYLIGHQDHGRG